MSELSPPSGYRSWLDYAADTMETRSLHLQSIDESPWGREVQRDEMRQAVRAEIAALRAEVERLRQTLKTIANWPHNVCAGDAHCFAATALEEETASPDCQEE